MRKLTIAIPVVMIFIWILGIFIWSKVGYTVALVAWHPLNCLLLFLVVWSNNSNWKKPWQVTRTVYRIIPPLIGIIVSMFTAHLWGYSITQISLISFALSFLVILGICLGMKDWRAEKGISSIRVLSKYLFIPLISIAVIGLTIGILTDFYVTIGNQLTMYPILHDINTGALWGIAIATLTRWFIIPPLLQKLKK